jgi:hypothetical protein
MRSVPPYDLADPAAGFTRVLWDLAADAHDLAVAG